MLIIGNGEEGSLGKSEEKTDRSIYKWCTDSRWKTSWSFPVADAVYPSFSQAQTCFQDRWKRKVLFHSPASWCDTNIYGRSSWSDYHITRLQRRNWASKASKMNNGSNWIRKKTFCQPVVGFRAEMGFIRLSRWVRWLWDGWSRRMMWFEC